jgi:alkylation response protein AidB-like acyl-CoA dehydrogenase
VVRYGDAGLAGRAARAASDGHLFGLWVTDPPDGGLVLADGAMEGRKQFCSGAGHVTRAVLTAADAGETVLVYAEVEGAVATKLPQSLAGMRAATTGQVRFDGLPGTRFGAPGDYLREPDFSCGAWRTSAVTLGGIVALTEQMRQQLRARGRQHDPHQQTRFGQALIATETARLWMQSAAGRAEAADAGADAVAYVGLARLAVERAALDLIELAQRSLGVAALMRGNPVERISRDLATYLRQPAADIVLTEAAAAPLRQP